MKQEILDIFKRTLPKHEDIFMTHPDTQEKMSLSNWYRRSPNEFYKVLSQESVKQRTKRSFLEGRMRNVKMSEKEWDLMLRWADT